MSPDVYPFRIDISDPIRKAPRGRSPHASRPLRARSTASSAPTLSAKANRRTANSHRRQAPLSAGPNRAASCTRPQTARIFIGSPTTGANGDVTGFIAPGNIRIPFSGHDVRWPDGRQLQRVGLVPDIEAHPTIQGIRAGRDEILERGNENLGSRLVQNCAELCTLRTGGSHWAERRWIGMRPGESLLATCRSRLFSEEAIGAGRRRLVTDPRFFSEIWGGGRRGMLAR
jgi:hypothetical protein